jgi:hypothetical protein
MRVLKKYENFRDFDIDFTMAKIKHHFPEYDVKNKVDDEIENWVDDENLKEISRGGYEYETKREWYDEHGSGEAEEVVADQLVEWFEDEFSQELTEEQKEQLSQRLLQTYDSLQY